VGVEIKNVIPFFIVGENTQMEGMMDHGKLKAKMVELGLYDEAGALRRGEAEEGWPEGRRALQDGEIAAAINAITLEADAVRVPDELLMLTKKNLMSSRAGEGLGPLDTARLWRALKDHMTALGDGLESDVIADALMMMDPTREGLNVRDEGVRGWLQSLVAVWAQDQYLPAIVGRVLALGEVRTGLWVIHECGALATATDIAIADGRDGR
jgi:hypothetical protein